MGKYNAESPKQGSRRFDSNVKTKYIADLGIVYLWVKPPFFYFICAEGVEGYEFEKRVYKCVNFL